jgi:hypothetical protein
MTLSEKSATFRDHALAEPSGNKLHDQEEDDRNNRQPG